VFHETSYKVGLISLMGVSTSMALYFVGVSPFQIALPFMLLSSIGLLTNSLVSYLRGDIISVLSQKDAHLRGLTNTIPILLAHFDKELNYLYVNEGYCRFLKKNSKDFLGKNVRNVLNQKFLLQIKEKIETVLQGKEVFFETNFTREDGTNAYLMVSYTPEYNHREELTGFFMTGVDITDRKEAEAELQTTQTQLVQSTKLAVLGEMSASIAHELNNPLMLIQGFLNQMSHKLRDNYPDAYKTLKINLHYAEEGTKRMTKIVDHLQKLSWKEGEDRLPLNINTLLKQSFTLLDEQLRLKKIQIFWDLDLKNPLIEGNLNRLEQVFINIVSNARDSLSELTEGIERKLWVSTRIKEEILLITFKDNGKGMDENLRDKIFEPFFTSKERGKGTGLGLSISLRIIKEHGGKIECVSSLKEGTTFLISLPYIPTKKEVYSAV
jgi:histidine kinase